MLTGLRIRLAARLLRGTPVSLRYPRGSSPAEQAADRVWADTAADLQTRVDRVNAAVAARPDAVAAIVRVRAEVCAMFPYVPVLVPVDFSHA